MNATLIHCTKHNIKWFSRTLSESFRRLGTSAKRLHRLILTFDVTIHWGRTLAS